MYSGAFAEQRKKSHNNTKAVCVVLLLVWFSMRKGFVYCTLDDDHLRNILQKFVQNRSWDSDLDAKSRQTEKIMHLKANACMIYTVLCNSNVFFS